MPGPEKLLHQLPAPHSASVWQAVVHAPVVVSQYGPGCVPVVHIASDVHFEHAPVAAQ
jgi:hypothetical protein